MEEKSKHTDKLIKDLLQEQEMKMPSVDFTTKLMERIVSEETVVAPKPIISRLAWFGIAASVAVILFLSFQQTNSTPSDFAVYFQWEFEIPELNISSSLSSAIFLLLSVLLWLFFVIDKYLSSKLKVR